MSIPNSTDSIVHIADLHFWEVLVNPFRLLNKRFLGNFNVWRRRRHEFLMDRAEPYGAYLAEQGVSQVLLTGDFTSTATEGEFSMAANFAKSLQSKDLNLHLMPGNHDVYTYESVRDERFERHFGTWLPEGGFPLRRELPGGTALVLVPTVCPNLLSSRGWIGRESLDSLEGLLDSSNSPLIVAGHYPLVNETPTYTTPWSRRLLGAEELRRVLGESGHEILYVCGHVHRFSLIVDELYPRLTHLSTGAFFRVAKESQSEGEFSVIHVTKDGFKFVRHIHRGAWEASDETPTGN